MEKYPIIETKNQKIERYTFDLLILEVVVGVLLEG